MGQHFRGGNLQGTGSLPGELDLPLEIRMLVHEIQQVVVDDRKLFPNRGPDIAVIIHVSMKYETHIHLFRGVLSKHGTHSQGKEDQGGDKTSGHHNIIV